MFGGEGMTTNKFGLVLQMYYICVTMKTKPTSLRFDEDDLLLAKNKSGIKKTQKLMDFLLSEFVREFKPKFIPLPEDYVVIKNISAIKSDGTMIKDVTNPANVLKPQEPPKTKLESPTSEAAQKAIREQIEAVRSEKIPPERNTYYGKKSWLADQQKRIQELQNKLK